MSVYKEIVNLGHFLTIGALYFDLAAKMVVTRKFGPDHTEMMFAIRTHKRVVAWHWRTPASWIEVQVGEAGTAVYLFLSHKSMKSLTVAGPPFGICPISALSPIGIREGLPSAVVLGASQVLAALGAMPSSQPWFRYSNSN